MSNENEQSAESVLMDVGARVSNQADSDAKELGESLQLIIFKLGGEEYALAIDQIKEVVLTPGVSKIPQTEGYIKGVANIRGTIIAIMDLEEKFNLIGGKESNINSFNYTLVIASESHKVGILVKEVPNTLSVLKSEIDRSSGIMQYSSLDEECIDGIVKSGERLIVLIDIFRMMQTEGVRIPVAS